MAKVTLKSKKSGRVVNAEFSPKQLLIDFIDESDLVQEMTKCNCQPVGETNVVDCNCDYEWEDYEIEIKEGI